MAEPNPPTATPPGEQAPRPAPPIAPYDPKLDQLAERGGPKDVPLPGWLKR